MTTHYFIYVYIFTESFFLPTESKDESAFEHAKILGNVSTRVHSTSESSHPIGCLRWHGLEIIYGRMHIPQQAFGFVGMWRWMASF